MVMYIWMLMKNEGLVTGLRHYHQYEEHHRKWKNKVNMIEFEDNSVGSEHE